MNFEKKVLPFVPGSIGKWLVGFVGGSKFKSQWGQKFTYQNKKKKSDHPRTKISHLREGG